MLCHVLLYDITLYYIILYYIILYYISLYYIMWYCMLFLHNTYIVILHHTILYMQGPTQALQQFVSNQYASIRHQAQCHHAQIKILIIQVSLALLLVLSSYMAILHSIHVVKLPKMPSIRPALAAIGIVSCLNDTITLPAMVPNDIP